MLVSRRCAAHFACCLGLGDPCAALFQASRDPYHFAGCSLIWLGHNRCYLGKRNINGVIGVRNWFAPCFARGFVLIPSYLPPALPFARRILLHFLAHTNPSATLSPSTDFPGLPVIRPPCSADFAA